MSEHRTAGYPGPKCSLRMSPGTSGLTGNGSAIWPLAAGLIGFMMLWAAFNMVTVLTQEGVSYFYVVLNVSLFMLAGLQGVILLTMAKRRDTIEAARVRRSSAGNRGATTEIHRLMAINDQQLAILRELRRRAADGAPEGESGALPPRGADR